MRRPSPITKGTANELLVAADLMKKGFDVFKALSHNSSCDLIFIDKNNLYRVEVKTIIKNIFKKGTPKCFTEHPERAAPFLNKNLEKNKDKFDYLAVVYKTKIKYYPLLPQLYETTK